MENIPVTAYSGFSNVRGEITLRKVMENITKGMHAKLVFKIRMLVSQGKIEEANNVKKQLPFYTVTAGYKEKRQAYSITGYTYAILLDIDDQPEEKLEELREKINEDPNTLASFLTPKGHGFKVFVFLRTQYALTLRESLDKAKVDFATLEKHHRMMYDACKEYYEQLLGVEVDGSGKDISRGFFTSYDEKAYLNEELLKEMDETLTGIIPPEKPQPGRKKSSKTVEERVVGDKAEAEPWEKMEFNKAVLAVKRVSKFEPGNRDSFMFALGNKCYAKGLEESIVIRLAQEKFGSDGFDAGTPIHNAYIYTDKTTEAAMHKEEKTDTINQVLDFLKTHYDIRRNVILDRLEYLDFNEKEEKWKGKFRPMRTRSFNSIFLQLQLAGIKCFRNFLQAVIDSSYARDFNPFMDYIGKLKPWDGVTDYIGELADTVQTEDREFWLKSFRRWFVGMLAGALQDDTVNHLVIILYSEQGKGKSTWIRRLLPPEWKEYYRNGMVDPGNKDHQILLSTHVIINMEEFEGVRVGDMAGLKRIITQESVTERKAYDIQAYNFVRHASFIASTNSRQCLQDIGGNRRFLPSSVTSLDYRTPVNYEGIYAQAYALLQQGYQYWYEGAEIDELNRHNELHRMKDPVEEDLFVYFRKPEPEDLHVKWMPAAAILSKISTYGKIQVNRQTTQTLVLSLEKYGFRTRRNEQGSTEYEVVDLMEDEINNGFKEKKEEKGKERGKEEEGQLPF
ncbi:VapE domain-containing protein [Bacteroides oleiciplenus]|uniref:Virulence protein E n=1 Tax=Bacteroides oleiciplenus TaxID=626931 RepID=A0A3E5B532_9BACE|nr:VapE domain-containing protein [Bacteroides oleiciplenus]RGN32666.1 virulence protein E [Bacteroides oleiciplenus]